MTVLTRRMQRSRTLPCGIPGPRGRAEETATLGDFGYIPDDQGIETHDTENPCTPHKGEERVGTTLFRGSGKDLTGAGRRLKVR